MGIRFTKEETQEILEKATYLIRYDYKSLVWSRSRTYIAHWHEGYNMTSTEKSLHQKTAKNFFKKHRDRFGKRIPYIVMEKGEIFPK